ncbi:hypothetical protein T11_8445 [Trichinella zimbabwensis]|uniref:PiggyBac transposable element-derived protein domain-containing protein n=1 Tax=Trichinella zimbabwensis TaxID=268475 RepID=A0A0V1HUJ9_9BILA|nr:hypothetical protein T11_8445 [Trichinella zimbabwensis]
MIEENCSKKCQLAVVAAWQLHCELHDADRSAMTHLAFRKNITAHLLRARRLQISRPGPRSHLPHSLRSSREQFLQSSTQGRCAVCKKKLQKSGVQCHKQLQQICFPRYHP